MSGMNWDKVRNEDKYARGAVSPGKPNLGKKKTKGFPARYPGACMICKKPIKVGNMIGMYSKGKAYHVACLDSPKNKKQDAYDRKRGEEAFQAPRTVRGWRDIR